MLKFLLNKLTIAYSLYVTRLHCLMVDNSQKPHVDYDIRGIAKVSAIQKVELERDSEEVFFVSERTQHITKCFDNGYYRTHGLIVTTEGGVNMESFKARITVDGQELVLNREEYQQHIGYRQDQARIVYPDGTVITDKEFVERVLTGEAKPNAHHLTPIAYETECADDESFALSAT